MSTEVPETPEDVIAAIFEGWPEAKAANSTFWRVQYKKQLDVHSGPDLKAGWQRVLENNPKGFPPKPDIIAAMCRRLKQGATTAPHRPFAYAAPADPLMTEQQLASHNLLLDEIQTRINRGEAAPFDKKLLKWGKGVLERHQRAVEGR